MDRKLLPCLSAYTRQATDRNEEIRLEDESWRDLARGHHATPMREKLRKLLKLVARRTLEAGEIGIPVDIRDDDYPAVDARSPGELGYLLTDLKRRGYDDWRESQRVRLTLEGWDLIEPVAGAGLLGRCFVAMSFHESLRNAWGHGIYPAVKNDCKCEPVRVDEVPHLDKICDRVIAEIRLAQFVVADVTQQRPNVYFEAGFAMGLGRPVIWMCQEADFVNMERHVDTRQYPHIKWSTPEDLREKLKDKILATILK